MSWYNDLHAGNIPGTEEIAAVDAIMDDVAAGRFPIEPVGHKDDGGGIQPWSKGEFYPWVWTCVGGADKGKMFYIHPDGRKSAVVRFGHYDKAMSFREAHALLDDIMKGVVNG